MRTVAIIPARGGSKRIPNKNIKSFLGKPIIQYSIEAAITSSIFDDVIVSTDSQMIAEISVAAGASCPFMRPQELADDFTGTNCVIRHAIQKLELKESDVVACIYPTAPLINDSFLIRAYEALLNGSKSFAFSVTSFPFPVQRGLLIEDGEISPINSQHIFTRSQDLPEVFHDAGQFYFGWAKSFVDEVQMFSKDSIPVMIPRHLVQDIDTPEDWDVAEALYKAFYR